MSVTAAASLDALIDEVIPASIRLDGPLELPDAESEAQFLAQLQALAAQNQEYRSFIGLGYYGCITPSVILRNVFREPRLVLRLTRRIRPRSPRGGWKGYSTSRRWCRT